jgi:hypothetical protein
MPPRRIDHCLTYEDVDAIRCRLIEHGLDLDRLTLLTWNGEQRHSSYSFTDRADERYWLKVSRSESRFAGLEAEARVLAEISGLDIGPELVCSFALATGVRCIVTRHVDGVLLRHCDLEEALPLLRLTLAQLSTSGARLPRHRGHHLFSTEPDVEALLSDATTGSGHSERRTYCAEGRAQDCRAVPIHGSAGLDNVVVAGDHAVLLDWEAARIGTPAFDHATLLGELLDEGFVAAAYQWVRCLTDGPSADHALWEDLSAWLQLRGLNRLSAGDEHALQFYRNFLADIDHTPTH